MFGIAEKRASSIAELLIIMAIVGILAFMYQRAFDKDAVVTKYAYKNIMQNLNSYAVTKTDAYQNLLPNNICTDFAETINTVGDYSCPTSSINVTPNVVSTSGMRFYGLGQDFQDRDKDGTAFIIIDIDTDGIKGYNQVGKDILSVEMLQTGYLRPSGAAVLTDNEQNDLEGNPARDPKIYTTMAYYVPKDATDKKDYKVMGNRLSYAESQCLTGNLFPYRERSGNFNIQMCVEDSTIRNAINNYRNSATDENKTAKIEAIREKEYSAATSSAFCKSLYTSNKSVAYGLTSASSTVIDYCQKCYKAKFKSKYCESTDTEGYDSAMCSAVASEEGSCQIKDFVDK